MMPNDPNPEAIPSQGLESEEKPAPGPAYDDIALRAYFIALHRHRQGENGNPLQDWIEAERQLKGT